MIRLAIRVRREDAEIVLADLMDLAPSGVEEQDRGEIVEYAVYGAEGELPTLPRIRAAIGDALVEVVSETVADDWADRWRAFHQPVLVAGRLHVRPPWSPPYGGGAGGAVVELVVDPGQAFGTGGHATTRLCLELLVGLADEQGPVAPGATRGPVLDLGCGSGVLAVAAAQLGWGPVHGLDNEQASVAATRENAAVNGVTVTAARFDLLRDGASGMPAALAEGADDEGSAGRSGGAAADALGGTAGGPARDDTPPLVLANLLRPLLLRVAADGFRGPPPSAVIASGLLVHEVDGIVRAFAPLGLAESERRADGDWAAVLLRRA